MEDITEKVDVSRRTFFRYFSSKEDVVLDYQQAEQEGFITALSQRPAHESVLTALRQAAVQVVKECEEGYYGFNADRFMILQELLRSHPLVCAKKQQNGEDLKASIIALIAKRMGSDANDIRPTIVAGVLDYVHSVAYDIWQKKSSSTLYSDVLNDVFLIIENSLNFPAKYQPEALD